MAVAHARKLRHQSPRQPAKRSGAEVLHPADQSEQRDERGALPDPKSGPALRRGALQPRVDRFALHREHPEDAFVDPVERLAPDEPVERLYPEPELADGECALAAEVP